MKEKGHNTAFYIETLVMIIIFVVIILVLTKVFAMAKIDSTQAQRLTDAVSLAQNTAETVQASDSRHELLTLLDEGGTAKITDGKVIALYNKEKKPDKNGVYKVTVTWKPEKTKQGKFVSSNIKVFYKDAKKASYSMKTEVYVKGGRR